MHPDDHAERRHKLLSTLGDGLLLLPTARQTLRNGDVHHEFRPGSNFYYLTGFPEPDAVLAAWRDGKRTRSVLFVLPRDKDREIWDGRRHGVRGAVKTFGVDEAHPITELEQHLGEMIAGRERLFYTLGAHPGLDARLMRVFGRLEQAARRKNPPAHPAIIDPRPALAQMRIRKTRDELDVLQRAAELSAAGHRRAMEVARPGMAEYQVQAEMEAVFRSGGSKRNGYPSIVASGANACILHYNTNERTMRRGDLLLIDAGAEVDGYTADITRTFPVSGRFSEPQRQIYRVVLAAQKAAIRQARAGKPWDSLHKTTTRVITKGLIELGLLRGDIRKLIAKGACRKWFMHGTSHWLGLDVHDVGAYQNERGKSVALQPGQVLTVEPGLYFDRADRDVPKLFRGIGVRIEDDVLITRGEPRVLTAAVPKEIDAVEALCDRR